MYTIIDLHWIKRDSDGVLFSKNSDIYQEYVDYCDANSPTAAVSVADASLYEKVEGNYGGKKVLFGKLSAAGKTKRSANLGVNNNRARGLLIAELCSSVHQYITGKNDSAGKTIAEIDAFLAAHGSILVPLQQNRHNSAKTLIDAVVPDQYITQEDKDAVQAMYDTYLPKINAIV